MWLLADLFHDLPEEGDLDKPKLVFFFDEAHLLFDDASKPFLQAIEQTVRLIRSKGVGVFFVTQSPKDVPADVLAQLGNRVQHALRAFTPDDAKALKQAIATYPHTAYDMEKLLTSARHRRGRRHRALREGRADARRVDPDEGAELAHGPVAAGDRSTAIIAALPARPGSMPTSPTASPPTSCSPSAWKPPPTPEEAPAPEPKQGRQPKEERSIIEQVVTSGAFRSMLRSAGTVIGREITRSIFGTSRRRR